MDRLINHLQQTLDDDEVAKDALLMLKTVCSESFAGNPVDPEEPKEPQPNETTSIEENSHIFILQMITSRILNDTVLPVDLPIKVIAMQLDISPKLIHSFCATQTMFPLWSSKFTGCFKQVLSILEWLIQTKMLMASPAQLSKLQYLRDEIQRVQDAPLGAVARFILGTVVDFISTRATPLPLQLQLPGNHSFPDTLPPLTSREIDLRELLVNPPRLLYRQHPAKQSSQGNKERVEEDSSGMQVILLAPLTLKPRSPKHFIVPLMEPDLIGNFHVDFPPQHLATLSR